MKPTILCLTLWLTGCGAVTPQSVYDGFRTQQKINSAGAPQAPDTLQSYGVYSKDRERLSSPDSPDK